MDAINWERVGLVPKVQSRSAAIYPQVYQLVGAAPRRRSAQPALGPAAPAFV
jgi:hypothetical protein